MLTRPPPAPRTRTTGRAPRGCGRSPNSPGRRPSNSPGPGRVLILADARGLRGDDAPGSFAGPVAWSVHDYLRNAKLQLTAVLAPGDRVPGLYVHPDHRRRLRRDPVRSDLYV